MKLDKIIYDVREILNLYSDDSEISDRYIIHLFNIKRAKYLRQTLNNFNRTIDTSIQQSYCASLEEVSLDKCGLDYTCGTLLRTTKKVPDLIDLHTKPAIVNIKPTNRIGAPFNFITKERMFFIEGTIFPNAIYAFLDTDNYIYIYSKEEGYKLLECIDITGIFSNPLDLQEYSSCCNCEESIPCFDISTTDYPLQTHYIDIIRNEIVQQLIGKLNIPEDKTNNADNE